MLSSNIVDKLRNINNSKQAIIVTTDGFKQISAKLEAFENVKGEWIRPFKVMPAVIGKNGFTDNKIEGDEKSPMGVFTLGICFGKHPNPGTLMPYRQTTCNDFWVDDVESPYYNTWQAGPENGRWRYAEELRVEDTYYDYAAVINYNTMDRIPGMGSAIFLHIWEGPQIPTFGCTAIEYDNMLKIIRWLEPSKKPIIIQKVIKC